MICIIPLAPAEETHLGLKSDSALATATKKSYDTPYFSDALLKMSSNVVVNVPSLFTVPVVPVVFATLPAEAVCDVVCADDASFS